MKKPDDITSIDIDNLSQLTRDRYDSRYRKLGRHIRTLGWGSQEQQLYRFEQTMQCGVDLKGAEILDVGCGFGDYLYFLIEQNVHITSYTGWDLHEGFIDEAKNKFSGRQDASFKHGNIFHFDSGCECEADVGVMLGLLNFNWKEEADNISYTWAALCNAFKLVRRALIVDFLSTHLTNTYPKEDFVYYHDPSEVLNLGLKLTPNVVIKHDYAPIPQKEFMLVLHKSD